MKQNLMCVVFSALLCLGGAVMSNAETKKAGAQSAKPKTETAIFAGGCFWCMQPPYDRLKGVQETYVGYTGGSKNNPTYEEVSDGITGHAEAIEIIFDPSQVSYAALLEVFWKNVDPTTPNRQFCDSGNQYRSAIFYADAVQKKLAEESKAKIEKSGVLKKPIVTELAAASKFYRAEDYHQKYYQKNPVRYKLYRYNCGRDKTLEQVWGSAPAH